jgi:hypothetical protein
MPQNKHGGLQPPAAIVALEPFQQNRLHFVERLLDSLESRVGERRRGTHQSPQIGASHVQSTRRSLSFETLGDVGKLS